MQYGTVTYPTTAISYGAKMAVVINLAGDGVMPDTAIAVGRNPTTLWNRLGDPLQ